MTRIPVLSIGSVEGGSSPAARLWRDGITRLARKIAAVREGLVSPINVNVIVQVPGEILTPDFAGVRTGHFSKTSRLLIVQVALPREPPVDVDMDLKSWVVEAVDEAERWVRKRRPAEGLPQLQELVHSL